MERACSDARCVVTSALFVFFYLLRIAMKWQLRLHLGVEYLLSPTLYPKAKRTFRQLGFNLEELRLLLTDQKRTEVAKPELLVLHTNRPNHP